MLTKRRLNLRRDGIVIGTLIAVALSAVTVSAALAGHAFSDTRLHWNDGSLSREYVTIVDHTNSAWPVYAAAIEWDKAPKLDVVYKYGSCSGSPGHCIGVKIIPGSEYGTTCENSGGFANLAISNNHLDPDNTFIRFNGNCNTSGFDNRDRRALACEEEGHVLGLDHAAWYNNDVTCMASGDIRNLHEKPRQHDFDAIDNIYSHSH